MKTKLIQLALTLVGLALPQFSNATTIDFDTFPGGAVVPDNTVITTQYLPVGVTFSSGVSGGAPSAGVFASEASSSPNMLVGSFAGAVGLYNIIMDFTPAASPNTINVDLISIGTGIVTVNAFASDHLTLLDTVSVTHGLLAGNGFGNKDTITLNGLGISRVVFDITQTTAVIDGYGIDNVVFSVPEPNLAALATVGMSALLYFRRGRKAA